MTGRLDPSEYAYSRVIFMSQEKTNQSWGGRFSEPVDAFVARLSLIHI